MQQGELLGASHRQTPSAVKEDGLRDRGEGRRVSSEHHVAALVPRHAHVHKPRGAPGDTRGWVECEGARGGHRFITLIVNLARDDTSFKINKRTVPGLLPGLLRVVVPCGGRGRASSPEREREFTGVALAGPHQEAGCAVLLQDLLGFHAADVSMEPELLPHSAVGRVRPHSVRLWLLRGRPHGLCICVTMRQARVKAVSPIAG